MQWPAKGCKRSKRAKTSEGHLFCRSSCSLISDILRMSRFIISCPISPPPLLLSPLPPGLPVIERGLRRLAPDKSLLLCKECSGITDGLAEIVGPALCKRGSCPCFVLEIPGSFKASDDEEPHKSPKTTGMNDTSALSRSYEACLLSWKSSFRNA